ncbi:MAG: adenylyl-sulfate kinase [Alphaproteobacteria bacterium]|uniref:Adenylyl-sulfate kinase n=1 Tax=Candidatus Nitrobium versatile TaxID=2884831 RepID=A0A953M166_9BACT|nr:adenylyl-sulfate kinase [Candidatus Nitrobium versatile]
MSSLVIWLTGLPGSGKSTLADGLRNRFPDFVILRMDEMRKIVTPSPTYSEEERDMVYRALVFTAKTLSDLGHRVIIDATANRRKWRDLARQLIPGFREVYLKCSPASCEEREKARTDTRGAPRNIYQKGRAGSPVPGIQAPYEAPLCPELALETDTLTPEEAVSAIAGLIREKDPL